LKSNRSETEKRTDKWYDLCGLKRGGRLNFPNPGRGWWGFLYWKKIEEKLRCENEALGGDHWERSMGDRETQTRHLMLTIKLVTIWRPQGVVIHYKTTLSIQKNKSREGGLDNKGEDAGSPTVWPKKKGKRKGRNKL